MNTQPPTKPAYIGRGILALMGLLARDRGDTCPSYQLLAKPKKGKDDFHVVPNSHPHPSSIASAKEVQQKCTICQKSRAAIFMVVREDYRVAKGHVCAHCFDGIQTRTPAQVHSVSQAEYEQTKEHW